MGSAVGVIGVAVGSFVVVGELVAVAVFVTVGVNEGVTVGVNVGEAVDVSVGIMVEVGWSQAIESHAAVLNAKINKTMNQGDFDILLIFKNPSNFESEAGWMLLAPPFSGRGTLVTGLKTSEVFVARIARGFSAKWPIEVGKSHLETSEDW